MLTARTLVEARTYLSLLAAAAGAAEQGPPATSLIEGREAWTVQSAFGDVAVPYLSEDVSWKIGALYGLGISQLIDAGQWILVAETFASRALEASMSYAGRPDQDRTIVEQNWQFAAEALGEAMKFLPEGAQRLPERVFWSGLGERFAHEHPDRITRAQLVEDYEFYTGALDDFRVLYGEA
ncbi:hypothetical protein [Nocardia carnea]|uniref:hypothetical protein n=1 Tax=Nocardia carnea TaxID=37328 RepID=UPI00245730EF|nr:hypothetical protein [Nocardia carnea]